MILHVKSVLNIIIKLPLMTYVINAKKDVTLAIIILVALLVRLDFCNIKLLHLIFNAF